MSTNPTPVARTTVAGARTRLLVPTLLFTALVVAAVGSLGAPLITSVATTFHVSLAAAQWTLTITLLVGAVASPLLGRLGAGPHRREAILATLVVVVAGSVLTVLPLPFTCLLIGRAAQGAGLGLTALMMGVARDHLPTHRAGGVIALVSVASTVGIGVGYPLAGRLTDVAGVRAAYTLGLVITALALLAAWFSLPAVPAGRTSRLDIPGTLLLSGGLLAILVNASQTSLWREHLGIALGLAGAAALLIAGWVSRELHTDTPLVDIRLLRHPAVAGANLTMALGGVGMYLLLTLLTRFAQTPESAGYGFGLSVFEAGLTLVPFSVMGFVAGRLHPKISTRFGARTTLATSSATILAAFLVLLPAHTSVIEILTAQAILGFGVGAFSAAMPAVILTVTPAAETSSAMAFNQVVRSVGFSFGSAIGGLVLAAHTPTAQNFPTNHGYTVAAATGMAIMTLTILTAVTVVRAGHTRRPTDPA